MPTVRGRKFEYIAKGIKAAAAYKKKMENKKRTTKK